MSFLPPGAFGANTLLGIPEVGRSLSVAQDSLAQFLFEGPNQPAQKPRNSPEEDFAASGVEPPVAGPSPTVPREVKLPDDPVGAENVKTAGQNIPMTSSLGDGPIIVEPATPSIHWTVYAAVVVLIVGIWLIRRITTSQKRAGLASAKRPNR